MNVQTHIEQLQRLDDESLLCSLKRHVGSSNRLNALVLAHLAEVDARGAYRQWACDTLAAYCVYELRLSEDEAQRRCRAARVARQFPVLFEMLADGSIHLTGIVLLAPYLTPANHREVLARARFRRKREIELLVAELAPARDVPALVEPLGAGLGARVPRSDWAAVAESSAGWVRQLVAGDGPTRAPSAPDDWHEELLDGLEAEAATAPARQEVGPPASTASAAAPESGGSTLTNAVTPLDAARSDASAERRVASVRYKVQFTADQAYVDLLEQARALLWHRLPSGDLAQLQQLALEALVEKLVLRKYGAGARSAMVEEHSRSAATDPGSDGAAPGEAPALGGDLPADGGSVLAEPSNVIGPEAAKSARPPVEPFDTTHSAPARCTNSRHVPAAMRSAVWLRDEARCTFVDARGVRCRATTALELHHERPFARGGPSTAENIRLRCRAHNELAAEQDFGRAFMLAKKQGPAPPDRRRTDAPAGGSPLSSHVACLSTPASGCATSQRPPPHSSHVPVATTHSALGLQSGAETHEIVHAKPALPSSHRPSAPHAASSFASSQVCPVL